MNVQKRKAMLRDIALNYTELGPDVLAKVWNKNVDYIRAVATQLRKQGVPIKKDYYKSIKQDPSFIEELKTLVTDKENNTK